MLSYLTIFNLKIPMYGLMMAIAFLMCGFWSCRRAVKQGQSWLNLIIIEAMAFLGAMVGGILLYDIVTYTPEQMGEFIKAGHIEYLLKGGIVFYGAFAGGLIGALLGGLIAQDKISNFLNAAVPVLPVGHALGRVGCFCAGCCYGCPTDSILGVVYPENVGGAPVGVRLFPIQLTEAAAEIVIAVILLIFSKKARSKYAVLAMYCLLYGMARFILEFFRYDSIRGKAAGLSTSQWISIAMILAAVVFIIVSILRKRQKISQGI